MLMTTTPDLLPGTPDIFKKSGISDTDFQSRPDLTSSLNVHTFHQIFIHCNDNHNVLSTGVNYENFKKWSIGILFLNSLWSSPNLRSRFLAEKSALIKRGEGRGRNSASESTRDKFLESTLMNFRGPLVEGKTFGIFGKNCSEQQFSAALNLYHENYSIGRPMVRTSFSQLRCCIYIRAQIWERNLLKKIEVVNIHRTITDNRCCRRRRKSACRWIHFLRMRNCSGTE